MHPLAPTSPPPPPPILLSNFPSIDRAQQLRLQDIFPLLILLTRLIRLVVLPPHRISALSTEDVPHDVPAGRHVAFGGFAQGDVDHGAEEEGFAVLTSEILEGSGC